MNSLVVLNGKSGLISPRGFVCELPHDNVELLRGVTQGIVGAVDLSTGQKVELKWRKMVAGDKVDLVKEDIC